MTGYVSTVVLKASVFGRDSAVGRVTRASRSQVVTSEGNFKFCATLKILTGRLPSSVESITAGKPRDIEEGYIRQLSLLSKTEKHDIETQLQHEKQRVLQLETQLEECTRETNEIKRQLQQLKTQLAQCTKEKNGTLSIVRSKTEKSNVERQLQEEKQNVQQLEKQLAECTKEKNEALSRLSEAVSLQLRDNNPDIVDLGDCHRPEKLSDMCNDIYDCEWVDASEQLEETGMEEEQCIQLLLDIILVCHDYCNRKSSDQLACVNQWMVPDKNNKAILQTLKTLKDARKSKALQLLPSVEKGCRLCLQQSINQLTEDPIKSLDNLNTYISVCVKLCWLMAVQDPPCVLVCPSSKQKFAQKVQNGQNDGSNQEGGSSLTLDDSGDEQYVIANDSSGDEELMVYDMPEFDKKFYKEYTQSGQYVRYVVWPCMLLHENGRLLSKGVVQCCKELK